MAVEIFNEGRITGYSAYEIYVKQHLAQDPNTPVASEREWLAASLGMGSSMLLKFPVVSGIGESAHCYVDIVLPSNCILAAANTIVASFFDGDAAFSAASCYKMGSEAILGGGWATKITDYGQLIDNSSATSSAIPAKTLEDWDDNKKDKLKDYMKIVDGLVLQPGTWSVNTTPPPDQDFSADLTGESIPKIRIHIRGPIEHNPLILLTGFTIKSVLIGTVGTDTAVNTASPQNGDFLGPAVFPWANKIVFSVPTSYIVYFASGAYERNLPADGKNVFKLVSDTPVIDMRSRSEQVYRTEQGEQKLAAPVLENYYVTRFNTKDELFYPGIGDEPFNSKTRTRIYDDVKSFSTLGDGTAVLTVYSRVAYFPPVLYGTFVSSTGENYLHPIDTAAPGTVKMFYNDVDGSNMSKYENDYPGTVAMNRTPEGGLEIFDHNGNKVSIPPLTLERVEFTTDDEGYGETSIQSGCIENDYDINNEPVPLRNDNPYILRINTGENSALSISLSQTSSKSTQLRIDQPIKQSLDARDTAKYNTHVISAEDVYNGGNNITWGLLLEALSRHLGIDILQDRLKSIQKSLVRHRTDTEGPYIEFGADDKDTVENPESPIRLYITNVAPRPENVPVGSIGIGWGFTQNQS